MQILGRGMVARSLSAYAHLHAEFVIFAGGIANSMIIDSEPYDRELALLRSTLNQCRKDGTHLVYFSSGGAIYGATESCRDEVTPLAPVTRYGKHKLLCETIIRESGARHLIIRLANLVGSNQNGTQLIPALARQVKSGHVNVQQLATRDVLDVDDFASILNRLMAMNLGDDTIVVASGQSTPVIDLVKAIQNVVHETPAIEFMPRGEAQRFSIGKLRSILPEIDFVPDYYRTVINKYFSGSAELS